MTPPTPTPKQNDSSSTHESSNDSPKSLNAKESNKNKMPKEDRKRSKTVLEQLSNPPKTKKSKTLVTGNARNFQIGCEVNSVPHRIRTLRHARCNCDA